jgi:Tfp pilus assembly protein PilN
MININLLPEELKKQRVVLPKGLFALGGAILIVLLSLWLSSVSASYEKTKQTSDDLENRWQRILELKNEYGKYKKTLKSLEKRSMVVNYLMADRINWAQKLNELSSVLIDGIWLNEININSTTLSIEGSVYSKEGREEAIVGNFMNDIKNNKTFFADFSDVELKIIKRQIKDVEHISFVLFCRLKQKEVIEEENES